MFRSRKIHLLGESRERHNQASDDTGFSPRSGAVSAVQTAWRGAAKRRGQRINGKGTAETGESAAETDGEDEDTDDSDDDELDEEAGETDGEDDEDGELRTEELFKLFTT